MRSIGRFSEQKLTRIALRTVNLVELTTIYANFGDVRQRRHSDAALPRGESRHYPIPVFFFNSVSILSAVTIGECSYSPVNAT
jgi:hypothetical protein